MSRTPPSLATEAHRAALGTGALIFGWRDAPYYFEETERGLAGSFIALILANLMLTLFLGIGTTATGTGPSAATQIFVSGFLVAMRYGTIRLVLALLGALGAFRAAMIAANWAFAIWTGAMVGLTFVLVILAALVLGPPAEPIVNLIVLVWAMAGFVLLAIEFNLYRLVIGLNGAGMAILAVSQIAALGAGMYVLGRLPL